MLWRTSGVQLGQHEVGLQRSRFGLHARQSKHPLEQLLGVLPVPCALPPVANNIGVALLPEHLLPHLHVSWHVWITVGLPLQPREQKQETGIRTEHGSGSFGVSALSTQRLVTVPQAMRIGEMQLLSLAHA